MEQGWWEGAKIDDGGGAEQAPGQEQEAAWRTAGQQNHLTGTGTGAHRPREERSHLEDGWSASDGWTKPSPQERGGAGRAT